MKYTTPGGARHVRETLALIFPTGVLVKLTLVTALLWGSAQSAAQSPPQPPASVEQPDTSALVTRDSLIREIKRFAHMVSQLQDSITQQSQVDAFSRSEGREALDEALEEFGGVISSLSRELSELDLDIDDQTITLRDKDGGGIEINIPEDLGEQISRGISSITQVILSELPDTLSWSTGHREWQQFLQVETPPAPSRVIGKEIVKIWNDIEVQEGEEVRGNVVTVFGDATIAGRVDGDVIVVIGDLDLTDTAEVTGQIVTVLGRLDRDEHARVRGSEFVLDPYVTREFGSLRELFAGGWLAFLAKQLTFLIVAFLVVILLVVFPADRLARVEDALVQNPATCLGYGLMVSLLGHIGLTLLFGVLVLTVIGIPLALLLLLGIIFIGLLAVAVVALEVGRWACRLLNLPWRQSWLVAMLGLILLHSLTFLGSLSGFWHLLAPLTLLMSVLGLGIKVLVYCFGIGALVISRLGTRGRVSEPIATPQAEA